MLPNFYNATCDTVGSGAASGAWIPIQPGQIASGAVQSGTIGSGAVNTGNIASGQVGTTQLASGSVKTDQINSGALRYWHYSANSIHSGAMAAGAVEPYGIASGAVVSGKTADGSVHSGTIASGQIGSAHIASGNVIQYYHIASGAIMTGRIGDGIVNSGNIASGNVGVDHLAVSSGAGTSGQVLALNGAGKLSWKDDFTGAGVASGAWLPITSGDIGSGQIGVDHLSVTSGVGTSGQVLALDGAGKLSWKDDQGGGSLASGDVVSGLIGNGAVVSGSIASGQIGANHLASGVPFQVKSILEDPSTSVGDEDLVYPSAPGCSRYASEFVSPNSAYAAPMFIGANKPIAYFRHDTTAAPTTSGRMTYGIYNEVSGRPGSLAWTAAEIVLMSGTNRYFVYPLSGNPSVSGFTPGKYWLACLTSTNPGNHLMYTTATIAQNDIFIPWGGLGSGYGDAGSYKQMCFAAWTYTSGMPATFPAPSARYNNASPFLWIKYT